MIRSCLPEQFCDFDDVLLLEEIGREITGQATTPATPLGHVCNEEASVRLVEVKGVFRNRLLHHEEAGQQESTAWSLEGIRLVAAILKDSEIVTVSTPSAPLECRHTRDRDGIAFEARWNHQTGSILSFDHHTTSDMTCYEVVLALVQANQTTEEYLLACPCGETVLRFSQKRNGGRRELPIVARPLPRNFVLFPNFHQGSSSNSSARGGGGGQGSSDASYGKMEEKKTESCRGDSGVELPYLSLEKATLGIEVSWQEKEMDVEVCYGGKDNKLHGVLPGNNVINRQQQLLIDTQPQAYSLHRFPKDEYSGAESTDENDRDDESYLSLRVREELDSLARQQLSPVLVYQQAGQVLKKSPSTDTDSHFLEDVMKALNIELEEANKTTTRPHPGSSSSTTRNQQANSVNQRSVSDLTLPTKESLPLPRNVSEGILFPKPKRSWNNAFRKGSSASSSKGKSSSLQKLDESVLEELGATLDDQSGVSSRLSLNEEEPGMNKGDHSVSSRSDKSLSRKGLFSGFRSKSNDRKQVRSSLLEDEIQRTPEPDALADLITVDDDTEERNDSPHSAVLSPTMTKSADDDTVGAIRLLDSFCSNGDEAVMDEELMAAKGVSQREASHLTKDSEEGGVTWVSHESTEAIFRKPKALSTIVEGALLAPHNLCTSLSDVTMDNEMEQKRSLEKKNLEKNKPLEHFRSMESFLSQRTTKSDEITTLSKIEDRMIMNAYHACGGRHIDRVTDAILRSAPGLFDGWLLESSRPETPLLSDTADDSVFSLADLDFERATTVASQALSRQLTTITEESETRGGLHARSSCSTTEPSSPVGMGSITPKNSLDSSVQTPPQPRDWVHNRSKASKNSMDYASVQTPSPPLRKASF